MISWNIRIQTIDCFFFCNCCYILEYIFIFASSTRFNFNFNLHVSALEQHYLLLFLLDCIFVLVYWILIVSILIWEVVMICLYNQFINDYFRQRKISFWSIFLSFVLLCEWPYGSTLEKTFELYLDNILKNVTDMLTNVSHDLSQVIQLSEKALWFRQSVF